MNKVDLPASERRDLWEQISTIWNIGPGAFWYPLVSTSRSDIIAIEAKKFHETVGTANLQTILGERGVKRILYFPEFDEFAATEVDLNEARFCYEGSAEGYWCDRKFDWIVYVSHEDSLTIGGAWLIDQIQELWPDWKKELWR